MWLLRCLPASAQRMRPPWLTRTLFGWARIHEEAESSKEIAVELTALRQTQESALSKLEEVAKLLRDRPASTITNVSARIALLIDADNMRWKTLDLVMDEVSHHGDATTRRAYGDFTTHTLARWKSPLAKHAIMPTQAYQHTSGKNCTDSRMIFIDAMELHNAGRFDVFCLVSSDSDFTSLAMRIREEGKVVGSSQRKLEGQLCVETLTHTK